MAPVKLNTSASRLHALHKPGEPVLLTNVFDAATAEIVVKHPATKAVATASYAIAAATGIPDDDMTFADNIAGIRKVAAVVSKTDLPLTADLQDGYDDVGGTITAAIALGVVGCNIEDVDNKKGELRTVEDAVSRIKQAKAAAEEAGVPDFCINARTDVLGFGGSVEDAIERGKAYLAAGAVTVFVWGGDGGRGVSKAEVEQLVKGLDGRLSVKMNIGPGNLNQHELAEIGVARISMGPELWRKAMQGFSDALNKIHGT